MNKFRISLFVFFFFLIGQQAWSANYYVLYDANCMDKLVYVSNNNGSTGEYIMYKLNANANEKVYLEIGSENQQLQTNLPSQLYTCNNTIFTSNLVQNINAGRDRLYLVIRKNTQQYTITPVIQSAYYQFTEGRIQFESPRFSFGLDTRRGVIGENIATAQRGEMYFEGKTENECTGAYLFTHRLAGDARPYTDLVFVPEVGITEMRNGQNATDALNYTIRLDRIGTYAIPQYLRTLCQRPPTTSPTVIAPSYSNQTQQTTVPDDFDRTIRTPATTNPNATPQRILPPATSTQQQQSYNYNTTQPAQQTQTTTNPCGIASANGYHVVQKGENLFRISKVYGITVGQIQAWNNLGASSTLRSCDRLRVMPPQVGGTGTGSAQTQQPYIADNYPAVTVPAPYEATMQPKQGTAIPTPAWRDNTQYHVVDRGETVASVALKYGYTEARLRDLNGLNKTEVVKIGQALKVSDCAPARSSTTTPNSYNQEFTSKNPYGGSDERIIPQFYQSPQAELPRNASGATLSSDLSRRMTTGDSTIPQMYDSEATSANRANRILHMVKEGENLYQIARNFGMSVERLRLLNNLGPNDVIIPYQKLYVN